jgi:hypothetical protein
VVKVVGLLSFCAIVLRAMKGHVTYISNHFLLSMFSLFSVFIEADIGALGSIQVCVTLFRFFCFIDVGNHLQSCIVL